jgi:hypothetical protein
MAWMNVCFTTFYFSVSVPLGASLLTFPAIWLF